MTELLSEYNSDDYYSYGAPPAATTVIPRLQSSPSVRHPQSITHPRLVLETEAEAAGGALYSTCVFLEAPF